jgi:hypothetical protein
MPILNFTEIEEANSGSGKQDDFEHLAAEFLALAGYTIVRGPSRGADGGKDLIVEERRTGKFKDTVVRLLVSCKHYAHSKKSVSVDSELNILERVKANKCDGFIGVYSTLASSSLDARLQELDIETYTFSANSLEKELLGSPQGLDIARRYFPISIKAWAKEHPQPVSLYEKHPGLPCDICKEDLLISSGSGHPEGIVGYCEEAADDTGTIVDVRWYHKGKCNFRMEKRYKDEGLWEEGWEELSTFVEPHTFITNLISSHDLQVKMNLASVEKYSQLLIATFPFVARELTEEEKEHQRLERKFGMSF